jgi:hypothetical protein
VVNGLAYQPLRLVPLTGATVPDRYLIGLCLSGSLAEQVSKQMVVAIPMALIIQGDHKEVGALEMLQDLVTGPLLSGSASWLSAENGITEWGSQAIEP